MTRSVLRAFPLLALAGSAAAAQMPNDAVLIPHRTATAMVAYAQDSWTDYWEGTLKRSNGNIGTLTTRSVAAMMGYGVTDRLNVMMALPYVWTDASQGVLHAMQGVQDLTVSAKFRAFRAASPRGALTAFVVGSATTPIGDYTPDFMPLSIGSGGSRASARATVGVDGPTWWFGEASLAYTFCNNVKLDRHSYYTNGELYLTNEVAMPNVLDYSVTAGITRGKWRVPLTLVQQRTLGGGDIRRQDMPFVSNRVNFSRVGGMAMYPVPKFRTVAFYLSGGYTVSGRNVGQAGTFAAGLLYSRASHGRLIR